MKEDFAYSRRMRLEKTIKPARRKRWREMATALAGAAVLGFLALNGYLLHWF